MNPKSFDLLRELVDDMVEAHPGGRYFHLGGDEARRLGVCPRCAAAGGKAGKGRLYIDFVRKAIEYVASFGLTPIVWDDMLCKHSEVLDELPRNVVIMYWEYWTTHSPSAIFVARPEKRGVVVDQRWKGGWAAELDVVERRMIDHFAQPIDFEKDLSQGFRQKFAKYLGPDFPKRVRAFPYLEYYQDLGFKVIGVPAGGSNQSTWRGLPDFPRYADNIHAWCQRLHEAGAMGVMTTGWYNFPYEALLAGITYTGQFAWNVQPGREG